MEAFLTGFYTVFYAMMKIAAVAAIAGLLVKKSILSDDDITSLSRVTVNVLLPCLIFSSIITDFDPSKISWWWTLPLAALAMNLLGLSAGRLIFNSRFHENRELVAMGALQNSAYLVLPLGQALFPDQFHTFANLCFIFVMGNTPVMWSAGKVLITGKGEMNLSGFMTPPLAASLAGVGLVLLNLEGYVPQLATDATRMLGSATIPVATFILGATLGQVTLSHLPPLTSLLKMTAIKFFLLPLATLGALIFLDIPARMPLVASLLIMEAAAAPATALILQSRAYGGDTPKVGSTMLISYFICIFAIPFWISLAAPFH